MRNDYKLNILFLIFILLFTACQAELQKQLTQKQADEIIVALQRYGIKADKEEHVKNRDITYTVVTSKGRLSEARKILVTLGLPKDHVMGIEQICGDVDAIIPSPSIDRCKFQLALQNEIVRAIQAIDGVVEARVNVNLPETNVLNEQTTPKPTAAVLIKYIADESGNTPFDSKKVREFVANSVDSLDYNDVTIMATAARSINLGLVDPSQPNTSSPKESSNLPKSTTKNPIVEQEDTVLSKHVDHQSVKKAKIIILIVTVLFLFLAAGVIAAVLHAKQLKTANDRLLKRHRRMQVQAKRSLNAAPRNFPPSGKFQKEDSSYNKEGSQGSEEISDARIQPPYSDQRYGVN